MSSVVNLDQATALLRNGQIGVLPTDTVMGLVASADNRSAVTRLYGLKQREGKPGTLIAPDESSLVALGLNHEDIARVSHLWPNPISVVLTCESDAVAHLHQGKGSLAVRIPADMRIQQLLRHTGPVVTSSANAPGQPPAQTLQQAQAYFGDAVDFYVAPERPIRAASSTVVQATGPTMTVLRQGSVILDPKTGDIQ